jgi:glycosyltransferase involved in cell wall biosynthesis
MSIPAHINMPERHEAARRKRVLIFAYACEPGRGSEPGAGWGLVKTLASMAQCTVLVGPEHMRAINEWTARRGDPCLRFVEVSDWWITPPTRRHRFTRFVVYLVWLAHAHRVARALHRQAPFDAIWHATYSTYWLPTPAVRLDVPCIWGPVGGAVVTPASLRPLLGWSGRAGELVERLAVRAFSIWPATRRTWRRARVRIVQNPETLACLPAALQPDTVVLNHAMFTVAPQVRPPHPRRCHCVFVGPLEARKGAALALHALACTPEDVTLLVIGDGPERARLETLACRLGVSARTRFCGMVSRAEAMARLAEAAAVVFTGLREEGGLALAEAMLAGTPLVVLAHGGARLIAQSTNDPARVALIEPADVASTARRMAEAMTRFTRRPLACSEPMLDRAPAAAMLQEVLRRACTDAC